MYHLPVAIAAGTEKDCVYYLLTLYKVKEDGSLEGYSWDWARHKGCRMDYWKDGTWGPSEEGPALDLESVEDTRKNGGPIYKVPVNAYKSLYCLTVLSTIKATALDEMFENANDYLSRAEDTFFAFSMDKEKIFDFLFFTDQDNTNWKLPCFFTASTPSGKKYQADIEFLPFHLNQNIDQEVHVKVRMTLSEVRKDGSLLPLPDAIMFECDWDYVAPKYKPKNPPVKTMLMEGEGILE